MDDEASKLIAAGTACYLSFHYKNWCDYFLLTVLREQNGMHLTN